MKNSIAQVLIMSNVQQGILFQSLSQENSIYDEIVCFKMCKYVEAEQVKVCWNKVLDNNIILRSIAQWERLEKPVLVVLKEKEVHFQNLVTEESIEEILIMEKEEKIDIRKDAIKITLVTRKDGEQFMILHSHHIFLDGWSTNLIIDEFERTYKGETCKKLLTYKDYLQYLRENDKTQALAYWKKQGEEAVFHMFLPYTHNSIACQNVYEGILSKEMTEKLHQLKNDRHITISTFFYAAWSLFLNQYNEIVDFGVTNSGRYCGDKNFEQVVGLFMSTYLFHVVPQKDQLLEEFYQDVNKIHLESLNYQNVSIVDIQDMFPTRMNEMNTLIVVENYPTKESSDLLRLYKVIEETHYDIVCQIYIEDCIRIKLITNPTKNICLEKIYQDYCDLISKMCYADRKSRISEILSERKCEILAISPFETKPLSVYWDEWGRRNNLHISTKAVDIRNIAFVDDLTNQQVVLFLGLEYLAEEATEQEVTEIADQILEGTQRIVLENPELSFQIYSMKNMMPWELSAKLEAQFEQMYTRFIDEMQSIQNVQIYNIAEQYTQEEIESSYDNYSYQEANIPYSLDFYLDISKRVYRNIHVKYTKENKVIVLDCDNTLWKGIAEEVGIQNVELPQAYREFQNFLLRKKKEGFLLAICSKNEEETVKGVFKNNPNMPLSLDDFVLLKVNWNHKSENIRQMAEELNLGLSSFLFVDDSIWECNEVMNTLPEVFTIQMPERKEDIMPFMLSIWAFDKKKVTEEDANRTLFYKQQISRDAIKKQMESQSDYLDKLRLEVKFSCINSYNLARVSQLSYRTNQFNLNGEKREEPDILGSQKENQLSYSIYVKDQFGSYGIVGYIEGSITVENVLKVTSFFLSCRVLGRKVEEAVIQYLYQMECMNGIEQIRFMFVDTGRNAYIRNFLKEIGVPILHNGSSVIYEVRKDSIQNPELLYHIVCVEENYLPEKKVMESEKTVLSEKKSDTYKKEIHISQDYIEALRSRNQLVQIEPALIQTEQQFLNAKIENEESAGDLDEILKGDIEKRVYEVWCEVLQTEKIGDFFAIGGNSLKAMTLAAKLSKKLEQSIGVADILKHNTFIKLVNHIRHGSECNKIQIPHLEGTQFPIPVFESHMYAMNQLSAGTVLNMPFLFQVYGKLDIQELETYFRQIIEENRILTAVFQTEENNPMVVLKPDLLFTIQHVELENSLDKIDFMNLIEPFDISKGPLLRVIDIQILVNKERYLLIDFHHLLMDGQSLGLLIEQLNARYEGREPVLGSDYLDYAEWFQKRYSGKSIEKQKFYWNNELKDSNLGFRIFSEVSASSEIDYTGESVYFKLDESLTGAIQQISKKMNVSEFCILLSIYCIYISRITGETMFNIGVPVSLRDQETVFHTIGMMVNTLVISVEMDRKDTFESLVKKIAVKVANGIEHKDFMFQDVMTSMKEQNVEVETLYDIMFVFQNFDLPEIKIPNVHMKNVRLMNPVAQSALILEIISEKDGYNCNFTFQKNRLRSEWMIYKVEGFQTLCRNIVKTPSECICKYPLVEGEMLSKVRAFGIGREVTLPQQTLFKRFQDIVQSNGKADCLIYQDRVYTYEEVNHLIYGLASKMKAHGVTQGDIIAVYCNNALHVAVGILAVFCVNAVYLPIAKDTPEDRMREILKESSATMVLCKEEFDFLKEYPKCDFDIQNIEVVKEPYSGRLDDFAYMIFTSGTTGKSKGVKIKHSAIANAIEWRVREYAFTSQDTSILLLGFAFDGFMTAFFTPLLSGAAIVLVDQVLDTKAVQEQIVKHKVTNMILTPTLYSMLLENLEGKENVLRKITLAGEAVQPSLVSRSKQVLPNVELINEYGPTENSVVSTYKRNIEEDDITIGKPIDNCQVRIVNEQGMDCPIGCRGELWLSGAGLSDGYLGDEELTCKKFVEDESGIIWYHTGDLACWLENGEISIFNRKDQQVKVHGYRIDLNEIEKNILAISMVKNCLVALRNKDCIACYYMAEQFIPMIEFMEAIRTKLPKYMIPHEYIRVSNIPVKNSGKVDINEVEKYKLIDTSKKIFDFKICEEITKCYKKVLNLNTIDKQDNFFALGGNSVRAVSLQKMINSILHLELSIVDLFTYPTIELLTEYVMTCKNSSREHIVDLPYKTEYCKNEKTQRKLCTVETSVSDIGIKNLKELAEGIDTDESIIFMALVQFFMQSYMKDTLVKCVFEYEGKLYQVQFDFANDIEFDEYVADLRMQLKDENIILEGQIDSSFGAFIAYEYSSYCEQIQQNMSCYMKSYNKTQKSICIKYNDGLLEESLAERTAMDTAEFLEKYEVD